MRLNRIASFLKLGRKNKADRLLTKVQWFDSQETKPRAILQVSPAVQENGVFVNYGGQVVYDALRTFLESRGFAVIRVPRVSIDFQAFKAQKPRLFVDCPGFLYSSTHHSSMKGSDSARMTAENARLCKTLGALTVAAPQTFGPFEEDDRELIQEVRKMLENFDVVCARDRDSANYVASLFPDAAYKIRIVPDSAFLYKTSREAGNQYLRRLGLDVDSSANPIVGITPSRQIVRRDSSFLQHMLTVIKWFKEREAQVVVIPHETGRFGFKEQDDQFLCERLAEAGGVATASRDKRLAFSAQEELQYISDLEAAIGALDFLVSGRFHAALRAVTEGVPCVVFSWSHKYDGLFEDLGLPLGDHILSTKPNSPGNGAFSLEVQLENAWAKKVDTRQHLIDIVPSVRKRVEDELDAIVRRADSVVVT